MIIKQLLKKNKDIQIDYKENTNNIDYKFMTFDQIIWIFHNYKCHAMVSYNHINRLLFYLHDNTNDNIQFTIKDYDNDNDYIYMECFIKEIDSYMESILFQFFYFDIQQAKHKFNICLSEIVNTGKIRITIEWKNLYLDIINNKIRDKHEYMLKNKITHSDIERDVTGILKKQTKHLTTLKI